MLLTYDDLKKRSPVEFWEWCCKRAEGWKIKKYDSIDLPYLLYLSHNKKVSSFSLNASFDDSCSMPQFIQRTIDGVNEKSNKAETHFELHHKRIFVFFAVSNKVAWFDFKDHAPEHGLTREDMARWFALICVWEAKVMEDQKNER